MVDSAIGLPRQKYGGLRHKFIVSFSCFGFFLVESLTFLIPTSDFYFRLIGWGQIRRGVTIKPES